LISRLKSSCSRVCSMMTVAGISSVSLFRLKELAEPVMFEPEEGSRATMSADDVR
jgi:hypothetical protein